MPEDPVRVPVRPRATAAARPCPGASWRLALAEAARQETSCGPLESPGAGKRGAASPRPALSRAGNGCSGSVSVPGRARRMGGSVFCGVVYRRAAALPRAAPGSRREVCPGPGGWREELFPGGCCAPIRCAVALQRFAGHGMRVAGRERERGVRRAPGPPRLLCAAAVALCKRPAAWQLVLGAMRETPLPGNGSSSPPGPTPLVRAWPFPRIVCVSSNTGNLSRSPHGFRD